MHILKNKSLERTLLMTISVFSMSASTRYAHNIKRVIETLLTLSYMLASNR